MPLTGVLEEIVRAAPTLHSAGTFSREALEAIYRHACTRRVQYSVETGSGASTLLFSHLSEHHTVFAMDAGTGSVTAVRNSPLLIRERVAFVEGPTQLTVPQYRFTHPLQLVLLDGPHAYPFPDLEYYFLYPHLAPGGLLIVDDVHIPTITHLFEFLSVDEMFELEELVGATAFFRRTEAATFPATGDDFMRQRYNRSAFESVAATPFQGPTPTSVDTPIQFFIDRFGPTENPLAAAAVIVPSSKDVDIQGWAVDEPRRQPAAFVDFVLDGTVHRAPVRTPRPDVAHALREPNYFRSGFQVILPAELIIPGEHLLEIRIVLNGGREYRMAATLRFQVRSH
jgi:hypothetical protein